MDSEPSSHRTTNGGEPFSPSTSTTTAARAPPSIARGGRTRRSPICARGLVTTWFVSRALVLPVAPDAASGVLRVTAGTSPMGADARSRHDGGMRSIAEEIISSYLAPFANPGLPLAAGVVVGVLVTGLGARIVELGEAIAHALSGASGPRSDEHHHPHQPPVASFASRSARTGGSWPSTAMRSAIADSRPDLESCRTLMDMPSTRRTPTLHPQMMGGTSGGQRSINSASDRADTAPGHDVVQPMSKPASRAA